jgi:hypothetical protein
VPNSIITDNGSNFTSSEFQEFTKKLGIQIKYASLAHPKTNGQVKKANRLVCTGLKEQLLQPLKRVTSAWVKELPLVLWSLRTTSNSSTGYMPFFLLFGAEVVLPTDVCYYALRVVAYVEEDAIRHLKTPKIYWTRLEILLSPAQQSTSKASATTTADGYADGLSSLVTLCFASKK